MQIRTILTLAILGASNEPASVQTMTFLVLIRKTSEGWKTFREVLSADQPTVGSEKR